jgi:hypothetical protein
VDQDSYSTNNAESSLYSINSPTDDAPNSAAINRNGDPSITKPRYSAHHPRNVGFDNNIFAATSACACRIEFWMAFASSALGVGRRRNIAVDGVSARTMNG